MEIFLRLSSPESETRREIPLTATLQSFTWRKRDFEVIFERRDDGGLSVVLTLTGGDPVELAAAVGCHFEGWSRDNYLLLPGAVYDGNRFRITPMPYPPLPPPLRDLTPTPMVTAIPHLETDGVSVLEQTTGDCSVPAMGFYDPAAGRSFLLLTRQGNRHGNYGFTVEEDLPGRRATLLVTSPVCRAGRADTDLPLTLRPGDEVVFVAALSERPAGSPADLFDHLAQVRNLLLPAGIPAATLPWSEAFRRIEDKYNAGNWDEACGYYKVDDSDSANYCAHWQLGWVGGGMVTLPLLFRGGPVSAGRARRNLETVFEKTVAPSGFFYGAGKDGHYVGDAFREPHPGHLSLLRKNADALYFLGKQFLLEEAAGRAFPDAWRRTLEEQAEAFLRLWRRYGQFGQFIDIMSGELITGGSASAAMAPAGLALAARLFRRDDFLDCACESALFYCRHFLDKGLLNGGPGEILQAPDSESAFALLESLVVLWEETGDGVFLAAARRAADLALSWCVGYDYQFPADSLFGRLHLSSTGTVIANAQNKHSAPGICTLSGDALFKLHRATGEKRYGETARQIARALPQFLSRRERPIGTLKDGWINERVNLGDWEGSAMVGNVFHGSCWPEVSLLLSALELPGIYARSDDRTLLVFDHLDAVWREDCLRIANPTDFPAAATLLIESAAEVRKPLGVTGWMKFRRVFLNPGADMEIPMKKGGI